ncbi:MAG TPA: tetratricopeptide repeat protein [Blastocatellia bacterium]|nr:tetratricopeptide repeat protein [Blastocatellia bacterium]
MSAKRFRIAFSFAGEKRDFVAEVANILAKRFGEDAILYDKFHEAEFARARLGRYLPKLYYEESELIVVVICGQYAQKEWTGLEWDAIFDLLKQRREQEVLLGRFDRATVDGLYSDAGFIDFDQKTPAQTATVILERLALNERKPRDYYSKADTTGQPALKTTIPNNLPRLQSFFGREKELDVIHEALDPEARTWGALIDGVGGIGKTSLAVRAAYDCSPDSFKRIIFLSVKSRELDDDGLRELGPFILPGFLEMLNELARELGQPDITKSAEDQRIRLLLDALRDTHTLLILDNLESLTKGDRDQLFTFVKRLPQGCKAILTSRLRIGSSSDELMLEELDETAALETLADLARHNRLLEKTSQAERLALYKQTGGKPLLLRWVAGQLGRGSCRTFADALSFLQSCPEENDPLEFIFGDLAEDFSAEETSVLAALTYFTLAAKVEHIVDVSGLDAEPVTVALRTLANRSLAVPDQQESVFALVPMVAEFMRRKRPEVVSETGSRLEERAYALITENGYQNYERFPVLDAAWPTVAPALPLFVDGENARLQRVSDALQKFLDFTGRWDERLSLSEQAEAKAVAAGDHYIAGWRAYQAGWIHQLRGDAEGTLARAERARAHWNTVGAGTRERATAIRLVGVGHELKENYAAGISAYGEALNLFRSESGENEDVASVLADLAGAERLSGDLDAAERDYGEALRIARAVGHAEGVAIYMGNFADLALDREDWPGAENLVREALVLSEQVGRQELIGSNCHRLAFALARQEKRDEALTYARRAVEIFTRLGYSELERARATLAEFESESSGEDND